MSAAPSEIVLAPAIAALAPELARLLDRISLEASERQQRQLLGYVGLLHKWNKAYNLTSVRDPAEMLVKHIIDSLVIAPYLRQGSHYIDVGTGPGLPGIPLAIMMPGCQFTLLDSLGKRVRFLRQVQYELGLANITPVQSRVEAYQPEAPFTAVLSRAFASIDDMLSWCAHLSPRFLAMKGIYPTQELDTLPAGFAVAASHNLTVPALEGERHLIEIKQS